MVTGTIPRPVGYPLQGLKARLVNAAPKARMP